MRLVAATIALGMLASPASAGPKLVIYALQIGKEEVRYSRGVPIVTLDGERGGVQIEALPFDHGGLSFSVALFNGGPLPATIDLSAIRVFVDGKPATLLSRDDLERKATNRARWSQLGVALIGAIAATGAASQRDTYRSTFRTPRGTYRSTYSVPSAGGQVAAAGIVAGTGLTIGRIQNTLDATIDEIGADALQITTIDPGESYAGRIVTTKFTPRKLPATVNISVNWYGEQYAFGFQVAKPGSPLPPFESRMHAPAEPAPGPPPNP